MPIYQRCHDPTTSQDGNAARRTRNILQPGPFAQYHVRSRGEKKTSEPHPDLPLQSPPPRHCPRLHQFPDSRPDPDPLRPASQASASSPCKHGPLFVKGAEIYVGKTFSWGETPFGFFFFLWFRYLSVPVSFLLSQMLGCKVGKTKSKLQLNTTANKW